MKRIFTDDMNLSIGDIWNYERIPLLDDDNWIRITGEWDWVDEDNYGAHWVLWKNTQQENRGLSLVEFPLSVDLIVMLYAYPIFPFHKSNHVKISTTTKSITSEIKQNKSEKVTFQINNWELVFIYSYSKTMNYRN